MTNKNIIIILIFSLITINSLAQISSGGKPISFKNKLIEKNKVFNTPYFNYKQLIEKDKQLSKSKKYRFGKTHKVDISPKNYGTWQTLTNGYKIWTLEIHSQKAFAIGLLFNKFHLNKNVKLFVYSTDKKNIKGAFTNQNNKINNKFSIIPVNGDKIIIELNVPANIKYGELNIFGIMHDYRGLFAKEKILKSSGSCNVNVNCTEGDDWQDEKRAVAKYLFTSGDYAYACTGALINNTAQNDKPYFLTANHCISKNEEAESATFIFNYESATCSGTTGSEEQSISVATLLSTDSDNKLDFTLLELSVDLPNAYNAYFAGWNRATTAATNTVCIHHPSEDIKKISKDFESPVTGDYGEGLMENAHWQIKEWDIGTTEGGSSGAPLFDQNHYIVGDLTGGYASCSYNFNDYYAKFDLSWDYYSTKCKQLKAWLDPLDTHTLTLLGKNPEDALQNDAKISYMYNPKGTYCNINTLTPKIILQNKGSENLTNVKISYKINSNATEIFNWTGNLQTGEFENVTLNNIYVKESKNEIIIYTSMPNGTVDMNKLNDTITSNFEVIDEIDNIEIYGDINLCSNLKIANYYTENIGNYSWSVDGGEIIEGNNTNSIDVEWTDDIEKKVYLRYTNVCGQNISDFISIKDVNKNLLLNIKTENSDEKINFIIKDLSGNTIVNQSYISTSENFSKIICVEEKCYNLSIYNSSPLFEYSLINSENEKIILSDKHASQVINTEFCLTYNDNNAYKLYPNPTNEKLTISALYSEMYNDASFAIYNLKGKLIVDKTIFTNVYEVNITELPKGTYILKISNKNGTYSQRFIKL